MAIRIGNLALVRHIIQKAKEEGSAALNLGNGYGNPPLLAALYCSQHRVAICRSLLQGGASVHLTRSFRRYDYFENDRFRAVQRENAITEAAYQAIYQGDDEARTILTLYLLFGAPFDLVVQDQAMKCLITEIKQSFTLQQHCARKIHLAQIPVDALPPAIREEICA